MASTSGRAVVSFQADQSHPTRDVIILSVKRSEYFPTVTDHGTQVQGKLHQVVLIHVALV